MNIFIITNKKRDIFVGAKLNFVYTTTKIKLVDSAKLDFMEGEDLNFIILSAFALQKLLMEFVRSKKDQYIVSKILFKEIV